MIWFGWVLAGYGILGLWTKRFAKS